MGKAQSTAAANVVLVTGASSGIGWATAERLVATGHRVYGTSRARDPVGPAGVVMRTLDVEDHGSVQSCVERIVAETGRIDTLVSNAGRLVHGLIEDVPLATAQRMFETNFWGATRMVNAVLPGMRARRRGQIIVVGSLSVWVTVPLNAFYSASKAALTRYAEGLRYETRHLGIRVTVVEPSDVATSIWRKAERFPPRSSDYAGLAERALARLGPIVEGAAPPVEVGRLIADLVGEPDPGPVYRVGTLARRMPWMRVLMPARFFERGLRKRFGLDGKDAGPPGACAPPVPPPPSTSPAGAAGHVILTKDS